MLVTIDELDPAGVEIKTTLQTDQISSLKQATLDFSNICQICHVEGGRIARHDYSWCVENNLLSEYHEREVGPSEVTTTIISMANGDVIVAKGEPQFLQLVGSN